MNKLSSVRTLTTNGGSALVTIPKLYIQALGWSPSETKVEVILEKGWLRVIKSEEHNAINTETKKGEFQLYKFAA
jgi:antitoxin component of MazEF toxin-antitoxin module